MAEWFKAAVLKTVGGIIITREFKSHFLLIKTCKLTWNKLEINMQAGKGDKPRPIFDKKSYDENYERIFRKIKNGQ